MINMLLNELKERILSAERMTPSQLVRTYEDSLKIENNPLSRVYRQEILRRLWEMIAKGGRK